MKKIFSYIFILIGLGLLVVSNSKPFIAFMWDHRHSYNWWGEHQNYYGDLTRISYLDDIKTFQTPKDYHFTKPADSSGPKNIDLYLWGDSYTEEIPSYAFACVDSFHYGRSRHQRLVYTLNKSKRNILILESAERFVRCDYANHDIYELIKEKKERVAQLTKKYGSVKNYVKYRKEFKIEDCFNPDINQNIEYLAFGINLFNKPRNLKADMNYYLFSRASGNVALSDDHQHLLLKETIEPHNIYSSYDPFSLVMADQYARNLSEIYDHFREQGFDEVYFAMIPNPVTMLQPARYNNLIPALQNNPALKMPVIDLYSVYKQSATPGAYYRAGDTHWNNKGIQVWITLVNEVLRKENEKAGAKLSVPNQ